MFVSIVVCVRRESTSERERERERERKELCVHVFKFYSITSLVILLFQSSEYVCNFVEVSSLRIF